MHSLINDGRYVVPHCRVGTLGVQLFELDC